MTNRAIKTNNFGGSFLLLMGLSLTHKPTPLLFPCVTTSNREASRKRDP